MNFKRKSSQSFVNQHLLFFFKEVKGKKITRFYSSKSGGWPVIILEEEEDINETEHRIGVVLDPLRFQYVFLVYGNRPIYISFRRLHNWCLKFGVSQGVAGIAPPFFVYLSDKTIITRYHPIMKFRGTV